jgi:hypothetical protein
VYREATPGSLIARLLNNPHVSFRREPIRHRLPVDTEHQQRLKSAVGHGKRDSTPVVDASLMAQRPLLDGGEGKLLLSYIDAMDNDTHVKKEIPPMDATTSNFPLLEFPPNIPGVEAVDPLIPGHGQTIPRSVSCTCQHHLNVAREPS